MGWKTPILSIDATIINTVLSECRNAYLRFYIFRIMKEKYNILDVIPYKVENILTEQEEGLSVIAFPRFKKAWMQKLLLPKRMSPYIRVRLEEHGTAVWSLIDGHRTVSDIIKLLDSHFEVEKDYALRVTTFIRQLQKDGFVKYRIRSL